MVEAAAFPAEQPGAIPGSLFPANGSQSGEAA